MKHRHLNHERYTLAAIDDVICRGRWQDWADMRSAALEDPSLFASIRRICVARAPEAAAMRHRFWLHYVDARRREQDCDAA